MKDDKKINIPDNSLFGSSPFGPNLLNQAKVADFGLANARKDSYTNI